MTTPAPFQTVLLDAACPRCGRPVRETLHVTDVPKTRVVSRDRAPHECVPTERVA